MAPARKSSTRRRKPTLRVAVRPPEPPIWRRPGRLAALIVFVAALLWLVFSGLITSTATGLRDRALQASLGLGLQIDEIYVTGRKEIPPEAVMRAIDAKRGDAILAVDLPAVQARLAAIPWVATARVERHLPNILYVALTERVPFARWQYRHTPMLVDRSGIILTDDGLEVARFAALPLVVGENANLHAADILQALEHTPFASLLRAAIRISDRRWDLRLTNGPGKEITLRLPELAPEAALARLTDMWHSADLAARGIRVVDARLPDRITLDEKPLAPDADVEQATTASEAPR